jgi:hypothetical protein
MTDDGLLFAPFCAVASVVVVGGTIAIFGPTLFGLFALIGQLNRVAQGPTYGMGSSTAADPAAFFATLVFSLAFAAIVLGVGAAVTSASSNSSAAPKETEKEKEKKKKPELPYTLVIPVDEKTMHAVAAVIAASATNQTDAGESI